jgi:hypothetical protein
MNDFTPPQTCDTTLSSQVRERARAADRRLREHPYFGRLLRGEADTEEYAAWLVQMHKYVRHAESAYRGLQQILAPRATECPITQRIHDYADWEADEEAGHDELVVDDLSVLWCVTREEARRRIEETPDAPSAAAFRDLVDVMLKHNPEGLLGVAIGLETLATLESNDIRHNLIRTSGIPNVEQAVSFLVTHSAEVESRHSDAAAAHADVLEDPAARSAVFYYANVALSHFETLAHFNHQLLTRGLVGAA